MRRKSIPAFAILSIGLLITASPTPAAERVTIAVGGFGSIAFLPHDVARALGYFEAEGLEVDSQYLQSGSQAATALVGGSADFAAASFDHVIKASVQGKPLKLIAAFSEVPGMQLLVHAKYRDTITDMQHLKGRPIGVTGLGAATHLVLKYVLTRGGLKPDEINAVAVGAQAMAAALENEKVDGLMAGALPAARLVGTGRAFVLLDLMSREPAEALFGGPYVDTGLLTRAEVAARRPEVTFKMVRAVVKANQWIATRTPAEVAAVLPEAMVPDRGLYATALARVRGGFSKDGRINPRALETVITAHRALGLIAADERMDVPSLYDSTFVDRVLRGGP